MALVMWRCLRISLGLPQRSPGLVRRPRDAFVLGMPFGLITCPACTPLLFPIAVGIAATGSPVYGAALMAAFAVGEGLPMVALGTAIGRLARAPGTRRLTGAVECCSGLLFAVGGGYLLVDAVQTVLRL